MYKHVLTGFTLYPTLTPTTLSFADALGEYKAGSVSEKVLIYPQLLIDPDTEKTRKVPIAYHILFFRANQGLRELHFIVEMRSYVDQYSSRAVRVCLSNKNFNHHTPGMVTSLIGNLESDILAGALREIENKLLNEKKENLFSPLFSFHRKDALFQYYVLLYQIKALRNE